MHRAAHQGNLEVIGALLGIQGIEVNATDESGNTALHLAIYASHEGAAKRLMEEPAVDINVKNNSGYTPLELACIWEYEEIIELLKTAQDNKVS